MGRVFNVAGGPIGRYEVEEEQHLMGIEVSLKEGYSIDYYLHDYFDINSVQIKISYTDGTVNENPSNYVYYPAGPLELTDTFITFKAVDGTRIAETHLNIRVKDYRLVDLPVLTNEDSLVYNGYLQNPIWSYDSTAIDIITDQSNTDQSEAGTYHTAFRLRDKETTRWNIDSSEDFFADQVLNWTIKPKPINITMRPPLSQTYYSNSYTYILRAHTGEAQFYLGNEYAQASPTGSFSADVEQGHIQLIRSNNFNQGIITGYSSNFMLTFNLSGDNYAPGDTCTYTIRANKSSFKNYEISSDFVLTFILQPEWEWGSPDEIADEYWFEGLARAIRLSPLAFNDETFMNTSKRVQLDNPVLGTTIHDMVCIGYDSELNNYGVLFAAKDALNNPLVPSYSSTASTSTEYSTSTFEQINQQYLNAFPGRNYLSTTSQIIQPGGYSKTEAFSMNSKVFIPAAYQIGLVTPNMDEPQTNQEEPYQGDFNGTFANRFFINDERRQKGTANAPTNYVPYWTRSTAVKCVTPDSQYRRNFIICNEQGTYELVDAEELNDREIYYVPMFKVGELKV